MDGRVIAPAWSLAAMIAVAVGGALGATMRWAVGAWWEHDSGGWPWATLIVNVLGCVGIGCAARRLVPGTTGWAFVVTGVLGGFTTFSTFAVELNDLVDTDRTALAALYVAITLASGVGATMIAGRRGELARVDA